MLKKNQAVVLAFTILVLAIKSPAHACFHAPPFVHVEVTYLAPFCAYVRPYSTYQEQGIELYNACEKDITIYSLSTYKNKNETPALAQSIKSHIHPPPKKEEKDHGCLTNASTPEIPCHGIWLPPHHALRLSNFGEDVHAELKSVETDILDERQSIFKGHITVIQPKPCPLFGK